MHKCSNCGKRAFFQRFTIKDRYVKVKHRICCVSCLIEFYGVLPDDHEAANK